MGNRNHLGPRHKYNEEYILKRGFCYSSFFLIDNQPRKHEEPEYVHQDDRNKFDRRQMFNPYISPKEIEDGLNNGTLYQGEMRLSRNRQDAYVKCDDLDSDIYIGGSRDRNRALQGDLVAVRMLDVDTIWELRKIRETERAEKRKLHNNSTDVAQDTEDQPDSDMTTQSEDEEEHKPKYAGEVVAILYRPEHTTYSGTIVLTKHKESNENNNGNEENNVQCEEQKELPRVVWFKPTDKRVPLIALFGREIPSDIRENEEYYKSHLFAAEIRRWQITDTNPAGRIVKEIGPIGYLAAEKAAVLADNSIIDADFSPVALHSLPELPWSIPMVEYKNRLDLRRERVFTIDPSTAKDLDDALHIKPMKDGNYEVGVHIADVTYFLRQGTPLDSEAECRGTSTYLADKVIPMLPSVLCEELCSLNPGVERLAFSVLWIMDKTGKIKRKWFGRTIIRSCARLAYEHAQTVIEGGRLPDSVLLYGDHTTEGIEFDIRTLYEISVHMRQRRKDGGSLSLHSVKLRFELDPNGDPVSFYRAESKEANKLVEEFMLCANISVANKILSAFPQEAFLRRHELPIERRLDAFLKLTDAIGLDFDGSTAGTLQASFNKIDNPDVKSVLLVLCIRTMQRAKYFCSGAFGKEKYLHYALNEPVYTHFTSPIRRYADVVVHRMLNAALNHKRKYTDIKRIASNVNDIACGYQKKLVQKIAFSCNEKRTRAKSAEDADAKLHLANYLYKYEYEHGPIYKKAVVIMTGKSMFEVYVEEYGLEAKIYMQSLPVHKFSFDKSTLQLVIFWKKDTPVTMHSEEKAYAQVKIRQDDHSSDEDEGEDDVEDDMEKLLQDNLENLKISTQKKGIKSTSDLIPPEMIDASACTQTIQMFSLIDVRIQVNIDASPPFINVYPVNPFAEK
ncbi:RNB-domain-containing protein [Rhizopus microsporus var. microsporus]|uniref:DIS3-like exonuclease 2 n=1 Tax=Rhizopus microsporus var. microsporus TaxID=86635 RepID=A0A1X0QPS5_RHIZD|nr:RNB-domain-containing protein [Rhizopus microsporus var. microsporus]